jgi:hypothetical protein
LVRKRAEGLERYLFDYQELAKESGAPRFLLNDIARYWRTIAVDYQAKRWEQFEQSWGLRYLKLVTSRKLVYAGATASLLRRDSADLDYLSEQFALPSLARLAQLHGDLEAGRVDDLGTVLKVADEFIGTLDDEGFRGEMEKISKPAELLQSERASKCKARAKALQEALERIFFDSQALGKTSRRSDEQFAQKLGFLPMSARMLRERETWPIDVAVRVAAALGLEVLVQIKESSHG